MFVCFDLKISEKDGIFSELKFIIILILILESIISLFTGYYHQGEL